MKYSIERRKAVLKKMQPPSSKSIPQISKEEGICEATLYLWRSNARSKGVLLPDGTATAKGWSSRDKFSAVLETASLNEAELGRYCRKKGIFAEQISEWRNACESANDWEKESSKRLQESVRDEKKKSKDLERELRRKNNALAETAALLVLQKKVQAIWGDPEGE